MELGQKYNLKPSGFASCLQKGFNISKIRLIEEDVPATTINGIFGALETLTLHLESGGQISMLFQDYSHPLKDAG